MGTPYEMRENLLARATEYLTNRYHAQFQQYSELNDMLAISGLKYPTTEEITELANVYKTFIETK